MSGVQSEPVGRARTAVAQRPRRPHPPGVRRDATGVVNANARSSLRRQVPEIVIFLSYSRQVICGIGRPPGCIDVGKKHRLVLSAEGVARVPTHRAMHVVLRRRGPTLLRAAMAVFFCASWGIASPLPAASAEPFCQVQLGGKIATVPCGSCEDVLAEPGMAGNVACSDSRPAIAPPARSGAGRAEPPRGRPPLSDADAQGFLKYPGARCNYTNPAVAIARTLQSAVVICRTGVGRFYYRGFGLANGLSIEIDDPVRTASGYVATNNGVRYLVSPSALVITKGSKVLSNEPMLEYWAQ